MKYMLIMRSDDAAKEAYEEMDFNEVITKMGQYNEQLINAGVLLAGDGLADDVGDHRLRRRLLDDAARRHRRPLRRDARAVQRLLDPRGPLEGGGRRVGAAAARWRRDRSSRCDASPTRATSPRSPTTSTSRRKPSGGRPPRRRDGRSGEGQQSGERDPGPGRRRLAHRWGARRRDARQDDRRRRPGRGSRTGGAGRGAPAVAAGWRPATTRAAG